MPYDALLDFMSQMRIWGWSAHGHDDLAVFVAEHPDYGRFSGWWDRTAADLEGSMVAYGEEPYHRVPDYWALPGVTELRILQGAD